MATSKKRWWALAALALTTLTVGLDTTVLSVALPTLAGDLHASTGDLQWFTTAYLLVLAAALLPAGMLGDRFGRKRMLLGGLVVFGAASVACAYATSSGQLIAARVALGLGAAVLMPLTSAVLTVLFDHDERPRALTVWVTASALGIPLGPLVGGWLLDNFWWGSVFLINAPLVLLAIVAVVALGARVARRPGPPLRPARRAAVRVRPGRADLRDHRRGGARLDRRPVAGPGRGGPGACWPPSPGWQRRAAAPLVDLALFRSRGFTWGTILATVASFAMLGLLFTLPQLFQGGVRHRRAGHRAAPAAGHRRPDGRRPGRRPAGAPARRQGAGHGRAGADGGGDAGRRGDRSGHRLRLHRGLDQRGRPRAWG